MRLATVALLCAATAGVFTIAAGCSSSSNDDSFESAAGEINVSLVAIDPTPLILDGRERLVDYSSTTKRFVAFEINVEAGAEIDLFADARSSGARPAIWLTDSSFRNIAVSNDGTTTAHIHCVVQARVAGKMYLVLRDADLAAGKFAIRGTGGVVDPDEDAGCTGLCSDGGGGGSSSGGGTTGPALVCEAHRWRNAVPAQGKVVMAFGDRTWVFADDAKTWSVVKNETAVTGNIPLPAGMTEMRSVQVEMAPSGRPLVTYLNREGNTYVRYAAFWDGNAFVKNTKLSAGQNAQEAHADKNERIYTVNENGLTEFDGPTNEIVRGALPFSGTGWTVGADGTIHVLHSKSRPSTIHPGDTAMDLLIMSLPHGSLTWSGDSKVTSNEGYGFSRMPLVAAADGSLHTAYGLSYQSYYFRSKDNGKTWQAETFKDIVSKATLVDQASTVFDNDPRDVKGGIRLIAAQDYDHVSITLVYAQGSFSVPGFYFIRRCPPFIGTAQHWPAERLAFSGQAFDPGGVAVNERGLATILTPAGARQDVTQ
jgi:hypothetical protein